MTAATDADSVYRAVRDRLKSTRTRWHRSDRGWKAVALGSALLGLVKANLFIPW